MKVFILGLAESGKTTVAKALSTGRDAHYISATEWVESSFRKRASKEDVDDYNDEHKKWVADRLRINPDVYVNNIRAMIESQERISWKGNKYIIDGVSSPRDFMSLFDYSTDIAVFLNRVDNPAIVTDNSGIAQNIMRDYCLWLSTMGLLPKTRWNEFNFRIPGEDSDFVKELSSRNSVTITKNINKAIEIMRTRLWKSET